MRLFRVGPRGDDRVVFADSADAAVRLANEAARAERAAWVRQHGNAPTFPSYSHARELTMVGGVETFG